MTLTCAVGLLVYCTEAGLRAGRGQQEEERAQRQQQPRPRHHLQQPGSVWAVLTMSGWRLWCQDCGDCDVKTGVKTLEGDRGVRIVCS